MNICAYTSICEEDTCWIDQYLQEVKRLSIPFVTHLDRCSDNTRRLLTSSENCVGYTQQEEPTVEFNETHKQGVMDLIHKLNYDWALAWDIDETYEPDARSKILEAINGTDIGPDYYDTVWLNLWGDTQHVRVDGTFANGHRVKLYNLHRHRKDGGRWIFSHKITNGAKLHYPDFGYVSVEGIKINLICLHHGMKTKELREMHKARWDRIYTTAVGRNPYGFWDYALNEEEYPPVVKPLTEALKDYAT